jgi:hypothetical protein
VPPISWTYSKVNKGIPKSVQKILQFFANKIYAKLRNWDYADAYSQLNETGV